MSDLIRYFSLDIDYDRPLAQCIADGRYNYVDPYVIAPSFLPPRTGRATRRLMLAPLGQVMTTREVRLFHRDLVVRPASIYELLALGAAHPELQREFPIIAFGSAAVDQDGPPSIPCLCSLGYESRDLYLDWTEYFWSDKCRLLGIVE